MQGAIVIKKISNIVVNCVECACLRYSSLALSILDCV